LASAAALYIFEHDVDDNDEKGFEDRLNPEAESLHILHHN